jgi:hypothetical protein
MTSVLLPQVYYTTNWCNLGIDIRIRICYIIVMPQKSVYLTDVDVALVKGLAKGLKLGFSTALHLIIQEWAGKTSLRIVDVEQLPHPEDAEAVPVITIEKEQ